MTPFLFKCRFFCNVVGLWRRYKDCDRGTNILRIYHYCYHQRNTAWLMSTHISFSSKSMGMKITNILLFVCPEKINYLSNLPHCHDFNIFPLVTLLIKLLMQLQLVDPHWNVICSKLSKVVYFSTKVLYKNYMKQVHLKFRKVDPPFKCCRF